MRGVIRGNTIYGSNKTGGSRYELLVGTYGVSTDGNPYLILMNNYVGCPYVSPSASDTVLTSIGLQAASNGANVFDAWDGSVIFTPTVF
jgi:hypothetical protein